MNTASAHGRVSDAAIRYLLAFRLRAGCGHAGRLVDVLTHVVVIALAAHFCDHDTEQNEAVIAVLPAAAGGREAESAVAVKLHIILQRTQLQAMRVKFRTEDVACAAGVRQQVMDRYLRQRPCWDSRGDTFPADHGVQVFPPARVAES